MVVANRKKRHKINGAQNVFESNEEKNALDNNWSSVAAFHQDPLYCAFQMNFKQKKTYKNSFQSSTTSFSTNKK